MESSTNRSCFEGLAGLAGLGALDDGMDNMVVSRSRTVVLVGLAGRLEVLMKTSRCHEIRDYNNDYERIE